MPGADAGRVLVRHETRQAKAVEQNAVRRFRADALDGQQPLPGGRHILPAQGGDVAVQLVVDKSEQMPKPAGLEPEIAGRPDEFGQGVVRQRVQGLWRKHPGVF